MSITAAQLMVKVGADTLPAEVGLARVGGAVQKTGGMLKSLAGAALFGLVAVGAAAVAGGVAAVKMAGGFQQSMTQLVTSAGESRDNIAMVSAGILDLAVATGTSTEQLAAGMYMIESAGFHGAAGLQVLKLAAEGAKSENADLGVVANAVTSALNAYGLGADSAAMVTNVLVASTAAGKMHMQDLADAVSNVLPATSKFKISLIDTTAAIATMTMQGDNASSAATHLRQMILALEAPAKAGAKSLNSIGLTTAQVSAEMSVSMPGAIQMITDALGKKFPAGSEAYNQALKNISGGSKQLMGMLELSGTSLKAYEANVASVTAAVKAGGGSIMGWSDIQQNFNFKMAQFGEVLQTTAIKIGTVFLPILSQLLTKLLPVVSAIGDGMVKGVNDLNILMGNMPTKVVPATKTWSEQVPVLKKVAGGWVETEKTINHAAIAAHNTKAPLSGLQTVLAGVGDVIRKNVIPFLQSLGTWINTNVVPAAQKMAVWFQTQVLPALQKLWTFIQANVLPVFASLASWIMTKVVPALESMVMWFMQHVLPILEALWMVIKNNVVPTLESVGNTIMEKLIPSIQNLWNKISPVLIPVFKLLGWVISTIVGPALNMMITLVSDMIDMVSKAIGKIGDFFNLLGSVKDNIGGAMGNVGNFLGGVGNFITGHAAGGYIPHNEIALVGERGPEYVALPGGSTVYPHGTNPPGMGSGGKGNTYNVNVTNQSPTTAQIMNAFRAMAVLHG